jgi:hypothetical protein
VASDGGDCCRLYKAEGDGFQGAPPVEMIAAALRSGETKTGDGSRFRLQSWWTILPAVGVAMLPNLACPACWPAYAGLLGSIGLGFLVQTTYLFPITAVFLALGVATLGYRARSRRGYGPLVAGLAAAAIVVAGKFFFQSDRAMYVGIALLISASAWNSWPKFRAKGSCTACAEVGRRG